MGDLANEINDLERMLTDSTMEPIKLSYEVIKTITKDFFKEIGRGGFGVVYLGTLRNGKVAVKKLSTLRDIDDKLFVEEVSSLTRVRHKNVIRFLGYCADTRFEVMEFNGKNVMAEAVRERLLCFEYVPNGSLDDFLKENFHVGDWNTRYQMIKGICLGLQYLHKRRINHLDLKPGNVLLDAHMEPKITDFGLSRCFDDKQSKILTQNIRGTPIYMAPELLENGEISFKSDIYSLGIIMEKLSGSSMQSSENLNKSLDVDCPRMKKCIEIARSCVHIDQHKRPTIDDIIDELNEIEKKTEMVPQVIDDSRNGPGSSMYKISTSASRKLLRVQPRKICYPSWPYKMPFSLQLTNRTKDKVAFMFLDFGRAKSSSIWDTAVGWLAPHSTTGVVLNLKLTRMQPAGDKHCRDMILVRSTVISEDIVDPKDVTVEWFNKQMCVHDVELEVVSEAPSQSRSVQRKFDKLQLCAGGATAQACPGSITTKFLELYPLELRLPFVPNKFIQPSINLTNNTEDDISFWIVPRMPSRYVPSGAWHGGTVSPRSTYAVGLTVKEDEVLTTPRIDCFAILMATSRSLSHVNLDGLSVDEVFERLLRENRDKMQQVLLFAEIYDHTEATSIRDEAIIDKVISIKDFGEITSIDVHPTEPLFLTGHQSSVCIWKTGGIKQGYERSRAKYHEDTPMAFLVKFIARRQCVLSGDSSGDIHVYTITPFSFVKRFKAHCGQVRSLAVHPSHPYVLSSSDDHVIKLWDWNNDWVCTREFRGHFNPVMQVALNPMDNNNFASVSGPFSDSPGSIKTWSIYYNIPKTNFQGGFKSVAYSAICNGRQYMVTLVDRAKIEIWDLQTGSERCLHSLKHDIVIDINVVVCHPTLPLIITGSKDGIVCIWNLTTCRLEYTCSFSNGGVIGFGFIDRVDYKRLVIGYAKKILLLQIDLQRLAGQQ